ncbi:hypothetical protein ACGFRG_33345 [Streptomyces sp. NPDC048696]|uniref:hypothetical protein n=1 Tax=Streptomyces sp. NPDC048696 TaxID=3365585 RepID=UPI003711FB84
MDNRASEGGFQNPLTFLGAALSTTASVIIALAAGKTDDNRAFLVFTAVFVAILALAFIVMLLMRPRRTGGARNTGRTGLDPPDSEMTYDVFISSPMASFPTTEQYEEHRAGIRQVVEALERHCQFKVYYAGLALPTQSSFQRPDLGAQRDAAALRQSKRFLLVVPLALISSVYVEAGYALALHKPSVYYHHSDVELPFMLRQASQYGNDFPRCKEYGYARIEDIVQDIETNKSSLFD